jgi:hypothetical protein
LIGYYVFMLIHISSNGAQLFSTDIFRFDFLDRFRERRGTCTRDSQGSG